MAVVGVNEKNFDRWQEMAGGGAKVLLWENNIDGISGLRAWKSSSGRCRLLLTIAVG
jgi:hypothetical protein